MKTDIIRAAVTAGNSDLAACTSRGCAVTSCKSSGWESSRE
jgi:hypothetical protein